MWLTVDVSLMQKGNSTGDPHRFTSYDGLLSATKTETDEESYRNVGISDDRIFIITKVNVLLCSEYSIASVSCSNMNGNPEYVS